MISSPSSHLLQPSYQEGSNIKVSATNTHTELVTAIKKGDATAQEDAIQKILNGEEIANEILTALEYCETCISAETQIKMVLDTPAQALQDLRGNSKFAAIFKRFFVAIPFFQEINITSDVTSHAAVQHYQMVSGTLVDATFFMTDANYRTAIRDGFFEIEMPASLKSHIEVLDRFAQEFYKDKQNDGSELDAYRGFNQTFNHNHPEYDASPVEGYMLDNEKPKGLTPDQKRENQVERFSLAKTPIGNHWQHYPSDVQVALQEMNAVGIKILQFVLTKLNLPEELHGLATGGAAVDNGDHFGLFNHFDPLLSARGLKAHQDWSNITVLRSQQPGLSAYIDQTWQNIRPSSDNHLIINFGTTLELLTAKLPTDEQINACIHQVFQQTVDRTSYTMFLDHSLMAPIFECRDLEGGRKLVLQQPSFLAYVNQMTAKTYQGDNTEWV